MAPPFSLSPLPWDDNALEPVISARTISFHYHKHHKAYVDTLNKLAATTEFADLTLPSVIKKTAGVPDKASLFNNAAQAWNHAFFWESLAPQSGGKPSGKIAALIDLAEQLRERDVLRGGTLARILEQREQRQQQQDDDDPEGEIAQIGIHRVSLTGVPPVADG